MTHYLLVFFGVSANLPIKTYLIKILGSIWVVKFMSAKRDYHLIMENSLNSQSLVTLQIWIVPVF